ncbi:MAG: hypothetical protein SFT90_01875 [Rickettsiales bacterium]|nr:hypothetical protein [Rickettsiales bacterium]
MLNQEISNCFAEKIGEFGIKKTDFEQAKQHMISLLPKILQDKQPVFDFENLEERISEARDISKKISENAETIYVLGTGGATLCGQTILGLISNSFIRRKNIVFIDNVDPFTIKQISEDIDVSKSHFLVISKSGGTLETITQFLYFLSLVESKTKDISENFTIISHLDNENNIIRNIAEDLKIRVLEHHKVGGRFSIFTNVSLIISDFVGLDISKFLNSAKNYFDDCFNQKNLDAVDGAVLNVLFSGRCASNVIFPYEDRLKNFNSWYSQIYAESLGKNNSAMSPIRAVGTLDQHSQLQQFLQGRKDKFFTLIASERKNLGDVVYSKNIAKYAPNYLKNKKIGDVINASFESTITTFFKNNIPARILKIPRLDEEVMGQLCAFSVLEIVLIGYYFQLNVFDQPAVEQGKKIAIDILQKGE